MFGFKEATDEQLIERVIKANKYRKYYALYCFIFSFAQFTFLFYLYSELMPELFGTIKRLLVGSFEIGMTIQDEDIDILTLIVNEIHSMGIIMGMVYFFLVYGGVHFLIHGLRFFFGGRKDRLLIKLYESANQNKINNETAKL